MSRPPDRVPDGGQRTRFQRLLQAHMRAFAVLAASTLLASSGCGLLEPDQGHVRVSGTVTVDGEPSAGWQMVLVAGRPLAWDTTDAEGRYEISYEIGPEGIRCYLVVDASPPEGLTEPLATVLPLAGGYRLTDYYYSYQADIYDLRVQDCREPFTGIDFVYETNAP